MVHDKAPFLQGKAIKLGFSTQIPGDLNDAQTGMVKFPVKVSHRTPKANIYGKSAAYPF